MQAIAIKTGLALVVCATLSACAEKDPILMNVRSSTPDEFSIMPNKPLEAPEDYEALPEPTPNGTNRAAVNPFADAVVALGGDAERLEPGRTNAGEGTLIAHAARYGAPANIREELAEEDLEYRRKNNGRLLERLFNVNVYFKSYSPQALDQQLELDRVRAAGAITPSAPPDPERF